MILRRPTPQQLLCGIREDLTSGSYRHAAERARKVVERHPECAADLVTLLGDELSRIGDKNPGKRGPRAGKKLQVVMEVDGQSSRFEVQVPSTPAEAKAQATAILREIAASESYDVLMAARDIVDGRRREHEEMTLSDAKAILKKWGLSNVTRQKFRSRLRDAVAKKYRLPIKKSRS